MQEQKAQIDSLKQRAPKYKRIVLNPTFYTPPISEEAVKLPGWYNEPVSFSYNDLPFELLVREALNNQPVSVDFSDLDKEDKAKKISLSASEEKIGLVLRRIGNQAGYALRFVDGRVVYSKFERRTFPLVALPGMTSGQIGRDGNAGGYASSQTSAVSSSVSDMNSGMFSAIKVEAADVFADLEGAIKQVLSDDGKVYVSNTASNVIVQDYPYNVREAEQIIKEFNEEKSKQVLVKISLIDVITSKDNVLGADVKLALNSLGDRINLGSNSVFTSGGQGTLPTSQFSFEVTGGTFDGTQLLVDALKKQGNVSRTVFQDIVATNATLATSKAVTRVFYIAEQTGNSTTSGGLITSGGTRQEMLETGQIMNIYPRIINDDVYLKLYMSISSNLGITTKNNESTKTYVESPKVADMEFDRMLIVPHGNTLVLGGMEVDSVITQLANAGYDLAGFSKTSASENKQTIMTISVEILRGNKGAI
ncbi:hypothetical protein AB9X29_003762 [Vibrio vulnificus]